MSTSYKRQLVKFEAGDRSMLVEPLDYLIIEAMPVEGTNFADIYQIGVSASELSAAIKNVPTSIIGPRLTSLQALGLIRSVSMVGGRGTKSWQRTAKGDKEVARWKQAQS